MKGQLPDESFFPTRPALEYAAAHRLHLADELAWWVDWCLANNRCYVDLQAGFRTWLRRAVQYGRGSDTPSESTERPLEAPVRRSGPHLGVYTCPMGLGCDNGWERDSSPARRCACLTVRHGVTSEAPASPGEPGETTGAPLERGAPVAQLTLLLDSGR